MPVASQYLYFSQWEHQTIHFAFLFLMVFMSYAIKAKSRLAAVGLYLCLAAALACCVYVYGNIEELEMSQGFPTRAALLAGLCLILGHGPGHVAVLGAAPAAGGRDFCGLFFLRPPAQRAALPSGLRL